jgi:hypothetical protein
MGSGEGFAEAATSGYSTKTCSAQATVNFMNHRGHESGTARPGQRFMSHGTAMLSLQPHGVRGMCPLAADDWVFEGRRLCVGAAAFI